MILECQKNKIKIMLKISCLKDFSLRKYYIVYITKINLKVIIIWPILLKRILKKNKTI